MKTIRIAQIALWSLLLSAPITTSAQFDTIANSIPNMWFVNSLTTTGPKLVRSISNGVDLLEPDLTPYRTLIFPTPPAGYSLHNALVLLYVTETLFDNDPSNIEFMIELENDTMIYPHGVIVGREDGTTLYFSPDHGFNSGYMMQWSPLNVSAWIVNAPDGALMALVRGYPPNTLVLQLPGHLPCIACGGSSGMGLEEGNVFLPPDLQAFPNPATDEATIRYELPPGETKGTLVFFNAQGAEVKRILVNASGTLNVSTAQLTAGTYLYQLQTGHGIIGARRLVVIK
jgi:hypothetical protein